MKPIFAIGLNGRFPDTVSNLLAAKFAQHVVEALGRHAK
jgi:hypothetical protein